jgi:hypothetical protein
MSVKTKMDINVRFTAVTVANGINSHQIRRFQMINSEHVPGTQLTGFDSSLYHSFHYFKQVHCVTIASSAQIIIAVTEKTLRLAVDLLKGSFAGSPRNNQ